MRARHLCILVPFTLFFLSCTGSNNIEPNEPFVCSDLPTIEPKLPFDVDIPNHPNAQCFAWQEFIALNWPAQPGSPGQPDRAKSSRTWGDPGDTTPTVWETYKEAHQVFLPGAAEPAAWGMADIERSFARGEFDMPARLEKMSQASGMQVLRMTSKVSSRLHRTDQAFSNGWLTGQNHRLTYYGIHMNRVAFDYIVSNRFYDARQQNGRLINLPVGRTGEGAGAAEEGAIEIKSAWLDLTGYPASKQRRFKTTRACVVEGATCRWTTVGLVGLHIVHKTETFPQWSWATFEHVDNAPDVEEIRQRTLRSSYTYHDPSCPPATCPANTRPASGDRTLPIQLVRLTPIPEEARKLNALVQQNIRRRNRDSVWQYYQLVDVQWPESAQTLAAINAPLPLGGPRPTSIANATLETYTQRQTCIDCHRIASVPPSSSQATDYSFLFGMADESPSP